MTSHILLTLSDQEATRLTPNGSHSGMDITIQNVNTDATIYIGGNADVSPTDYGFKLKPDFAWSIELSGKDALYAIASVADAEIAVLTASLEEGN